MIIILTTQRRNEQLQDKRMQQISKKRAKDMAGLNVQVDPMEIVQEV